MRICVPLGALLFNKSGTVIVIYCCPFYQTNFSSSAEENLMQNYTVSFLSKSGAFS